MTQQRILKIASGLNSVRNMGAMIGLAEWTQIWAGLKGLGSMIKTPLTVLAMS